MSASSTQKSRKGRKIGRNIRKYGKAVNVTRKVRRDSRPNPFKRSPIAFTPGSATREAHKSFTVETPVNLSPGHSRLMDIPIAWLV